MPINPPDIKELKAIVDWVNLTDDVRELSIKYADVELFISRNNNAHHPNGLNAHALAAETPVLAAPARTAPAESPTATPAATEAATAHTNGSGASSADSLGANEAIVKAPMVGTFYAAPKPGDPPFVKVGDTVTASSVVGIVEVMKLMNNLEAKVDGTVTRILVENEQAVQYGQPLMVITRDA